MEKRCAELEAQNKELQAALALQFEQRNGGSFVNQEWDANGNKSGRPYFSDHRWAGDHQGSSNISPYLENGGNTPPVPISRTFFRPMSTATHYLGMSAGNSYLNSMKDTALKLLGIEVDLSVLDPADPQSQEEASLPIPDDDQMLKIMFNQVPRRPAVPLPEYQEAMRLINYFFTISHPYLPILHKPSFMKLVRPWFRWSFLHVGFLSNVCMYRSNACTAETTTQRPRRSFRYIWCWRLSTIRQLPLTVSRITVKL